MFVMFIYDVPEKRTGVFRRILRKYLGHEQYSVFYADIPESKYIKLTLELQKNIKPGDKIKEFICKNRNNMEINNWIRCENQKGPPKKEKDTRHTEESTVL